MVAKHLAAVLLGSALIAAPALAQTSPGSGSTTSPSTGTAPTMNNSTGSSSTTGSSSPTGGSTMTQMQPGQWRASKLEGLDVYNNNNEKIGDISELLMDESGKVQAVVVGVGGFLGMGEHDVAIPFEQVKFMNEPRTASSTTTGTAGTSGGTTTAPNTTGSVSNNAAGGTSSTASSDRSVPDHALVDMTKDQLKAMPEFKYNQ